MAKNFTPEDLIQYLYKETSKEETAAIEAALKANWTLREKLDVIRKAKEKLDTLSYSPRTEAVLKILRYGAVKETSAS